MDVSFGRSDKTFFAFRQVTALLRRCPEAARLQARGEPDALPLHIAACQADEKARAEARTLSVDRIPD